MHYLSFEFQSLSNHHPGGTNAAPYSSPIRFLRDFKELREEGTEAAVRRIVEQTQMVPKIDGQDYPAPVLGPLVKCVEDALMGPTEEIVISGNDGTTSFRDHAVAVLDLPNNGCDSSVRVSVERFTARATVADVPDDDYDEEYDYDSELDRRLCEDVGGDDWMAAAEEEAMDEDEEEEEEEEAEEEGEAVDVEAFLEDVRVGGGGENDVEGVARYYCGVCLEEMAAGSEGTATRCQHIYHGECIRKWLMQKRKNSAACPLCRFPAAAGNMH